MSLKTTLLTSLVGIETAPGDLRSGSIKTLLARKSRILLDGTGLNQANRIFADEASLATQGTSNYDLYDFAGAVDARGNLFALSKIRGLFIRNNAADATAILRVGGEGSTAAWMAVNGSDTVRIADIAPGGELALIAPSLAGYAVADVTNHLLKLENLSSTFALALDIVVLGSQ